MKKQDLTWYSTLHYFSSTILQFSAQTIKGAPSQHFELGISDNRLSTKFSFKLKKTWKYYFTNIEKPQRDNNKP